jgi:hypothetical protein
VSSGPANRQQQLAEDAAAKACPEIGPGRYNLSLSASEIQPAA